MTRKLFHHSRREGQFRTAHEGKKLDLHPLAVLFQNTNGAGDHSGHRILGLRCQGFVVPIGHAGGNICVVPLRKRWIAFAILARSIANLNA